LNALRAYLRLSPSLAELRTLLDSKQLNANYLPVVTKAAEGTAITPEWLLANYDFARARAILKTVPGSHLRGPYLLSTLKPPGRQPAGGGNILFQDLSSTPPDLVQPWYEAFLNQASQERFWEAKTTELLALKLRTIVDVMAQGLSDVKKALASWIEYFK